MKYSDTCIHRRVCACIYTLAEKKYDKLQRKSSFKNLSLSHTRSYDFVIERLLVIISGKKVAKIFYDLRMQSWAPIVFGVVPRLIVRLIVRRAIALN